MVARTKLGELEVAPYAQHHQQEATLSGESRDYVTGPRVFISYARRDGGSSARALRERLQSEAGISVAQDLIELRGGEGWWDQLAASIRQAEYLLLVLTPAALASEYVRREWRLARREGVGVVPVTGSASVDTLALPAWLEHIHVVDPLIPEQWQRLCHTLLSPSSARRVPHMAPVLEVDCVPRPTLANTVKSCLTNPDGAQSVVLYGPGGVGKTTTAAWLCADEDIEEQFHDGVLWLTLGQDPGDLTARIEDLIFTLTDTRPGYADSGAAVSGLARELEDREVLLVIDDAWSAEHLRALLQTAPHCRHLITTRSTSIAPSNALTVQVQSMQPEEALQLVAWQLDGEPSQFGELARRLGHWPLLLRLVNAVLRERTRSLGQPAPEAVRYVSRMLDRRGFAGLDRDSADLGFPTLREVLAVSLASLSEAEQARFQELCIFPEDAGVPLAVVTHLWSATAGFDEFDTEELLTRLHRLSLLDTLDLAGSHMRVHDVVRACLREAPDADVAGWNRVFLDHVTPNGWESLTSSDTYLWDWLCYHASETGEPERLSRLLLDPGWMRKRIAQSGVGALSADYRFVEDTDEAAWVGYTLRLAAQAVTLDPSQLSAQLHGRLAGRPGAIIETVLSNCRETERTCWLQFGRASLAAPGGALIANLGSHGEPVLGMGLGSSQLQLATIGSRTGLKLWAGGEPEARATLNQHTANITALAVNAETGIAVTGDKAGAHCIWSLADSSLIATCHFGDAPVSAVVVVPSGQFVSGNIVGDLVAIDANGQLVWREDGAHSGAITALHANRGCIYSAASGTSEQDWCPQVRRVEDGVKLRNLPRCGSWVNTICTLSDGSLIAGSDDGTIRHILTSSTETSLMHEFEGGVLAVTALDAAGDELAVLCDDGVLACVSAGAVRPVTRLAEPTFAMAGIGDGYTVATGDERGSIKLWDMRRSDPMNAVDGHSESVVRVHMSADGRVAASTSLDETLRIWSAEDGTCLAVLPVADARDTVFALDTTGSTIAMVSGQQMAFYATDGTPLGPPRAVDSRVQFITYDRFADAFWTTGLPGGIELWDRNGRRLERLGHPEVFVPWVATSSTGAHVLFSRGDNRIEVWNRYRRMLACALDLDSFNLAIACDDDLDDLRLTLMSESGEIASASANLDVADVQPVMRSDEFTYAFDSAVTTNVLVSCTAEGDLTLWSTAAAERLAGVRFDWRLVDCAISDDASVIAAGDCLGRVHFIRPQNLPPWGRTK